MMIARRRIIESLSKISRWIYKAGGTEFYEGSKEGKNYGLSFSPMAARRLRLSPYTLHWVTIYVPSGEQIREEKQNVYITQVKNGNGILSSNLNSNCMIEVEAGNKGLQSGCIVNIIKF